MALTLQDISTSTLLKVRKKYAKAMVTKKLRWKSCEMCFEVMAKIGKDTNYCLDCPLYGPAWCRVSIYKSRLNPSYVVRLQYNSVNSLNRMFRWERDVTLFLKWISEELMRRGVDLIK